MRSLFFALPVVFGARFSETQLELARAHLRQQTLHHTQATGSIVDEFVEKMMEIALRDTDNLHHLEDWAETTTSFSDHRGDVIRTTYESPSFKLMTGGAHFTINSLYRMPVPEGDYVVVNQTWNIVDENGDAVPLTTMYNHHWLIGGNGPLDMCEDDYFWGGGAEYRNMDYSIPDGYGIQRVAATGNCGANLHFINTEDLLTHWNNDFNDPKGDHGAALKLACECGWEPTRADGLCEKWGDGSFLCCFTESRARVNKPLNRKKKSFHLKGTFEYLRDLSTTKPVRVSLIDIGGNARTENGQMLDEIAEWNVAANLNNEGLHTRCNDTVCTMTNTITIGDGRRFGYGICSGDMLWSYIHVHSGTLGGSMSINGVEYCQSHPVVGDDPSNPAGNEQGFLVKVTQCVDHQTLGNKVRLEKGDQMTVTAFYEVDSESKKGFPMPGGKHGGIMGLFFSLMNCDDGTWGEMYVSRNGTCVGIPRSKKNVGTVYPDRASCEAQGKPHLPLPEPQVERQVEPVTRQSPASGHVNLMWRDCGSASKHTLTNMTGLTPATMKIGGKTAITGTGVLSAPIDAANFSVKMSSGGFGLTLMDFGGDACGKKVSKWTLLDQIHLTWKPLSCPLAPGQVSTEMELFVDPVVPVAIAHTTTTVQAHSEGREIFCFELVTQAQSGEIAV